MINSFKNIIVNLKTLNTIFGRFKKKIIALFFLIQITAILESAGLGLILPMLEAIIKPLAKEKGILDHLGFFLNLFPEQSILLVIGCLIILLILIKSAFSIYRIKYGYKFVMDVRRYWMTLMMDKYMRASFSYILPLKQGVLLNNLLLEPRKATKGMDLMTTYLSTVFVTIYLYILLFAVNWKFTLMLSVLLILIFILMGKFTSNYSIKVGRQRIKYNQRLNSVSAESISAIRQAKIFSMEGKISSLFKDTITKLNNLNIRFRVITSLPKPLLETLIVTGAIVVILYMAYVVKINLISIIPILGLFVVIGNKLFINLSFLVAKWMEILSSIPSIKLVHNIATDRAEREEIYQGKLFSNLKKDITIKRLTFGYHDRKRLFEDLNMIIPSKKMTALVGSSGSGKSTIADLLLGFYFPQKGKILINDTDLRDINLNSWRKKIGFITQDTFIFNASIKKNILIGKPDATDEEVINAAKQANAHEFIQDLPKGYDTLVGERGMKLSGGQRQRIAIARAIIRNPEFFIFDEATSSLDTKAERLIQKSIDSLGEKKTVLCITHRTSTIINADLVYKLENGRIVEAGSVKEVLGKNGDFV